MTEQELLELAADRPAPAPDKFWSSNVYGIGKWLKRYVGYPDRLPLCAEIDHGPHWVSVPHKMYLESQAPLLLFHNQQQVDSFRDFGAKPCAAAGSAFAYYRWMNGIRVASDAAGTLAIPTHSTHHLKTTFDWRAYCRDLRSLPARFQPVTISLYWKDILNGTHRVFLEEGFEVVTSGHIYDDRFIERFYRNLSRHRFVTSNEMSTGGIYGLEMGQPYFLWGSQEYRQYNTGGDIEVPSGASYRRRDLVGYHTLTPRSLEGLRALGVPADIVDRLTGLRGQKVLEETQYRRLLEERLGGGEAAAYLPRILECARVPWVLDMHPEMFQEPRLAVTAEQKAFCHTLLGLNSARPRAEIRELLLSAFESAQLGTRGTDLVAACGREADASLALRGSWGACPACGSLETGKDAFPEGGNGGYPCEVGRFALCADCGTGFRGSFAAFPEREALGPEPIAATGVPGWREVPVLEETPDPLAQLARSAPGSAGLLLRVPALGVAGLAACRGNAEARTLFTASGLHRLLARAGLRPLSVFRAPDGTLRAAARAAEGRWTTATAPIDMLARSRALLRGADPEPMPPAEADLLGRIVAVGADAALGRVEKGICLAKLLELVRKRPLAAEPGKAVADLHRTWGDSAAWGYWLGMYSEAAGADRFPREELRGLHREAGIPESLLDDAEDGGEDWKPDGRVEVTLSGPEDAMVQVLELLNAERFGEALSAAEAGLRANREHPDLQFGLAIALNKLERVAEAVTALERLVAGHPGYLGANRLLARLAPDRKAR